MLTGDNGIITQAQNAKNRTEEAEEKEKIELAVLDTISKNGNLTEENLQIEIDDEFGEGETKVYPNGDEDFSVIFQNKDSNYRIENGEVTKIDIAFKIENEEDLQYFTKQVNNGNDFKDEYVYLLDDINLNNEKCDTIGNYVDDNNNQPFAGIFEGNNKKISGIDINKPEEFIGMFPYNTGTIRDLILESGNITAKQAGGFTVKNVGKIINCVNKVNINANNNAGGIAGQNKGKIIASCNEGKVEGNGASIGGIVGNNYGEIVDSCYNIGNVINNKGGGIEAGRTGGIIGANDGEVRNSYNAGTVNTKSDCTGGIVGINRNEIINCYNLGYIVNSAYKKGGIVGCAQNSSNIVNCINSGTVENGTRIGGIIGEASGNVSIDNCKSNAILNGKEFVGGIVGYLYGATLNIISCKWYSENSDVHFGKGSTHSNENATYVENLKLENVINIINGENKFKMSGEKVVLNWQ